MLSITGINIAVQGKWTFSHLIHVNDVGTSPIHLMECSLLKSLALIKRESIQAICTANFPVMDTIQGSDQNKSN